MQHTDLNFMLASYLHSFSLGDDAYTAVCLVAIYVGWAYVAPLKLSIQLCMQNVCMVCSCMFIVRIISFDYCVNYLHPPTILVK